MEGYESMAIPQYLGSPVPLEHGTSGDDYLPGMPLSIPKQPGTYETGDFTVG